MQTNFSNSHTEYAPCKKKTCEYFDFRSGWQNPIHEKRKQAAKTVGTLFLITEFLSKTLSGCSKVSILSYDFPVSVDYV